MKAYPLPVVLSKSEKFYGTSLSRTLGWQYCLSCCTQPVWCGCCCRGHDDEILDIAFDCTGQHLATASSDGESHAYVYMYVVLVLVMAF